MLFSRFPTSLLSIYLFFLLLSKSSAQDNLKLKFTKEQVAKENKDAVGRIFALAEDGPTLKNIRSNPNVHKPINELVDVFRKFRRLFKERFNNSASTACNLLDDNLWVTQSRQVAFARQIEYFNNACPGAINARTAVSNKELDDKFVNGVRERIQKGRSALYNSMKTIKLPEVSWTNTYEVAYWNLTQGSLTCTLDYASAYVIKDKLYLIAQMTNHPVQAFELDRERQPISEFIPENFLEDESLHMVHPLVKYNGEQLGTPGRNVNATTLIEFWSGSVALASIGNMNFNQNPAIRDAVRKTAINIDLADDAITRSNIAILALPMVMSLIPVAFIAELNTFATLWYIVFTDIFSAIPFIIKGIELIDTASPQFPDITVYRSGDQETGQIEIFAASCQGKDNFRNIGISFVVLGLVTIIGSMVLEIYANMYMKKKRLRLGMAAAGPFGMALFQKMAGSVLAAHHDDDIFEEKYMQEKERRYSQEAPLYRECDDDNETPERSQPKRDRWWRRNRDADEGGPPSASSQPDSFDLGGIIPDSHNLSP